MSVDFLLTGNPVEDSPLLGALAENDQETVIKVIDAMIAKQRMGTALTSVDVAA